MYCVFKEFKSERGGWSITNILWQNVTDAGLEEYREVDQEVNYLIQREGIREGLAEKMVSDVILKTE